MKKYRWPILDVYGVPDQETLIEKCLVTLKGLTLLQQFEARSIAVLYARPLLIEGGLGCAEDGFVLLFDSTACSSTADQCITIAHEIAHTFEFKLETRELYIGKRSARYTDESEDFAETFANRWLKDEKTASDLRLFLERYFKMAPEEHRCVRLRLLP